MRSTVAIGLVVAILLLGMVALNSASQASQDAAVANGTNTSEEAHNLTDKTFGAFGEIFAPGVVWFGVIALILLAAAMLVNMSPR